MICPLFAILNGNGFECVDLVRLIDRYWRSVVRGSPGDMGVLRTAEENTGADAELVLAIALEVAELGVKVVGLKRADPDVSGNRDIDSAAEGKRERGVVTGGELADGGREVAVEAMDSAEERLSEQMEAGVCGDAHSQAAHAVKEAQAGIEVGDLAVVMAAGLDDEGEVAPHRQRKATVRAGHPEAAAAAHRSIGAHLAEDGVAVDGRCRPLGNRRHGERRQQRVNEDSCKLVHRSSYWTVRATL